MISTVPGESIFKYVRLNYMAMSQCKKIHLAALEILERVGVRLYLQEAVELLREAGAKVNGNLVRIPPCLVERALLTVPKQVDIFNRDRQLVMPLEGKQIYFGPSSDALNIIDHRTGKRRKPVLEDVKEGVKLCDALSEIDFVMSMVLPCDVDTALADRYQMQIMLSHTKKPIVFITYDFEGWLVAVRMAEIVAGGEDQLRQKPNIMGYVNITTGLRHNKDSLQKLLLLSGKGLPTIYAPDVYSGVTGPITIPGSVALVITGVLVGIVISQLKCEGAPIIIPGWGGVPMDLRTTLAPYCHPDARNIMSAMGRYYGLPVFSIAGCTEAKLEDQQAAAEAALTLLTDAMAGNDLIHDIGSLESGMSYSFPQVAICAEIIRWIKHYLKQVEVNKESLFLEIEGIGQEYINPERRLTDFGQHYRPEIFECDNYDSWMGKGNQNLLQRATEHVESLLYEHLPDPLSKEIETDLNRALVEAVGRAKQ